MYNEQKHQNSGVLLPPIQAHHGSCPVSSSKTRQHIDGNPSRQPTKQATFLTKDVASSSSIHNQAAKCCSPTWRNSQHRTREKITEVENEFPTIPPGKRYTILPPIGVKALDMMRQGKGQSYFNDNQEYHEPCPKKIQSVSKRHTTKAKFLHTIDEPTVKPNKAQPQDKISEPNKHLIIKSKLNTFIQPQNHKKPKSKIDKIRSKEYSITDFEATAELDCPVDNNGNICSDNYDKGELSEALDEFLYWSPELSAFLRSSARKTRRNATCKSLDPLLENVFEKIRQYLVRQTLEELGVLTSDWVNFQ